MFNKKLCKICSILFIFIIFLGTFSVYADKPKEPNGATAINAATDVAKSIWGTVRVLVQILAVAAIVFAGLRYMFASADAKADIKNQTVILITGAVLVFGAVKIAQFVYNVTNQILK